MRKNRYPNIEAERARMGLNVQEMCSAIGVKSTKTYNNWVRKGEIPRKKIEAMADLFHVSTDYLLGVEESSTGKDTSVQSI